MIGPEAFAAMISRRVRHRALTIAGLDIFYRETGLADAPTLLLLHGFPSASHQYTRLIDRLSDRVHLIAPDYPGFGYSSAPTSSNDG
jgi:pimeloyl-ACP methyl ester carboxylesterase